MEENPIVVSETEKISLLKKQLVENVQRLVTLVSKRKSFESVIDNPNVKKQAGELDYEISQLQDWVKRTENDIFSGERLIEVLEGKDIVQVSEEEARSYKPQLLKKVRTEKIAKVIKSISYARGKEIGIRGKTLKEIADRIHSSNEVWTLEKIKILFHEISGKNPSHGDYGTFISVASGKNTIYSYSKYITDRVKRLRRNCYVSSQLKTEEVQIETMFFEDPVSKVFEFPKMPSDLVKIYGGTSATSMAVYHRAAYLAKSGVLKKSPEGYVLSKKR